MKCLDYNNISMPETTPFYEKKEKLERMLEDKTKDFYWLCCILCSNDALFVPTDSLA